MIAALIDTNIIVDLLRKYAPAESWLSTQQALAVTRAVWLEILEGVNDSHAQQRAIRLLKDFELLPTTNEDMEWAVRQLARFGLRYSVDAFDCLIAAPAQRLNLPLYRRNLKHMTPLLGALAQQPY